MTRLLCTGDQHFGAGADLGLKPGERLAEQEAVWDWTLAQSREREVDAILHAGDVFEHRKPTPEAMLAFERPLVRHLAEHGPRVLLIPGNHDVSSQEGGTALDVFAEAGLIELERTPRVALAEGGALVCCLPWAPTSRLAASTNGNDRNQLNQTAARLLVDVAEQLYLNACEQRTHGPGKGDTPVVLLTHFSISGTSLPSGLDVGQLREPVLPAGELEAIGFDAIIAGHIHRPQPIGDTGIYVGSPMSLNFGEADGLARGPWLVTLDTDPVDCLVSFEQLPAQSRAFINVEADEVFEGHDVEGAYVKLRVHGTERDVVAHDVDSLREGLLGMGAHRVFVELQVERAARARDASVDDTVSEDVALAKWFAAQNGTVESALAARALERAQVYFERVNA